MRGHDNDLGPIETESRREAEHDKSVSTAGLLDMQRVAGNQATVQFLGNEDRASPVLDVIGKGGGDAMEPALRGHMESRLGHDFGDVRVHTNETASDSAKAVGAQAYTVGNEIVFGSGTFEPNSEQGQKTIAHELTHVVQQKAGPVDATPVAGGIAVSDPSDRFEQEAEANAERALRE